MSSKKKPQLSPCRRLRGHFLCSSHSSHLSSCHRSDTRCGGLTCSKIPVSASFSGSLLDSLFSISDSPLVGLRPFSLPMFHPELRCVVLFSGSSLSLIVVAGLLPQVTTKDHCFTIVSLHSTLNELTLTICSRPIFTKSLKRLSILIAGISTICFFQNLQYFPTYGNKRCLPFGRLTCVLSALPISPL